ncbi:MAG: ATP synthase F1 subunit gamma [Balneolales bacterium]
MANLRDIRDRIGSVKNTQQITRAMKMVAAARLRKAQQSLLAARPYSSRLKEVIARLMRNTDTRDELLRPRPDPEQVLFIVIASDRGLCGGFNANLFRVIENRIERDFREKVKNDNFSMICIGKKANDHFKKRGYTLHGNYSGFFEDYTYEKTADIMEWVVDRFKKKKFDAVYLCFNEFMSAISQRRLIEPLLPVAGEFNEEGPEGSPEDEYKAGIDYIYEPSPEKIIKELVPLHLNIQLWRSILESHGSEQGARMAAMDNATENAGEIISDLQLKYNQARQAAITTEISEIVSGAEALGGD